MALKYRSKISMFGLYGVLFCPSADAEI